MAEARIERRTRKVRVTADLQEAGDNKLRTDPQGQGRGAPDQQIRRTMDELMEQAIAQIKACS
jgi:hypothetical protein